MRICLLADGESIHTVRWCMHFHQLGHDIHLISLKKVDLPGIHVHHLESGKIDVKGGNWKVLLSYRKVRRLLKTIRPDILHALYATSYGMLGAMSQFHPYVVTPLGTDVLISPAQSVVYRKILGYVFKQADVVTSMAPHMREAMLALGASEAKVEDVVLGINTEVFKELPAFRKDNEFIIASIRNFEPVYNLDFLIRALAKLKQRIPSLKVLMTGQGTLRPQMEQLAKDLGLSDTIQFLGRVPQEKIVEVLNRTHVSVSVSFSDGNNLSLLEAMACGAYPVASDIPANRQWVSDGKNGRLVSVNDVDALVNTLEDVYKQYPTIIGPAKKISDELIETKGSWKSNMNKMEQIYKKLIAHE